MLKGIDVSTIQGVIDWHKVYADGIRFAMVKATQGRGEGAATRLLKRFTDSRFKANVTGAADAGLAVGVYHYFTAATVADAQAEAEYFVNVIKPYKDKIALWACVDVESMYLDGIRPDELYKLVRTFMSLVRAAGYKPLLYTNPNFLKYRFPLNAFGMDDIWLAHWGVQKPMTVPNTQMWQYGEGKVNGIKGNVDLNHGYFSEAIPAICKLAALGVIDSPKYWLAHYRDIDYIDELIIKTAARITKPGAPMSDLTLALERLSGAGIINTPQYWKANAGKVPHLTELIYKLGGCV